MVSRNRQQRLAGERKWAAKLTGADVAAIRARLAAGESVPALAREYGVHHSGVYRIRDGKLWKHGIEVEKVPGPKDER